MSPRKTSEQKTAAIEDLKTQTARALYQWLTTNDDKEIWGSSDGETPSRIAFFQTEGNKNGNKTAQVISVLKEKGINAEVVRDTSYGTEFTGFAIDVKNQAPDYSQKLEQLLDSVKDKLLYQQNHSYAIIQTIEGKSMFPEHLADRIANTINYQQKVAEHYGVEKMVKARLDSMKKNASQGRG